jgi:hypothetical protein
LSNFPTTQNPFTHFGHCSAIAQQNFVAIGQDKIYDETTVKILPPQGSPQTGSEGFGQERGFMNQLS